MVAEKEFSFDALSSSARRHIRLFQAHQFLDRFAMGLTVAVVALALIERDMDRFHISILFGIYSLTTLALELPFGGLAYEIGRKPVFLAAVVASVVSLVLFISTSNFYILAVSFAFIGLGRALRSGTLGAWFVEGFKLAASHVDVQPSLAKAQSANALGLACGAVCGGLLPDLFGTTAERFGFSIYDVSYLVSLAVMLGVFVFTLFLIDETPRPIATSALKQGFAAVPSAIKDVTLLAFTHPTLSLLLVALAFFLAATNPVEVLWPTFAKPMAEGNYSNSIIGLLTAIYFFSIAFGAWLSPNISRIFNRRQAVTLFAAFSCITGIQFLLALQTGLVSFAIILVLFSVVLGVVETPASSILHRCVEDHQRSTMLSLRPLVQQLGATIGLVLARVLAEIYSTPTAWILIIGFLVVAAVFRFILSKRIDAGEV